MVSALFGLNSMLVGASGTPPPPALPPLPLASSSSSLRPQAVTSGREATAVTIKKARVEDRTEDIITKKKAAP
jgi:hypothetical protein